LNLKNPILNQKVPLFNISKFSCEQLIKLPFQCGTGLNFLAGAGFQISDRLGATVKKKGQFG
jgi:hypothetical protein